MTKDEALDVSARISVYQVVDLCTVRNEKTGEWGIEIFMPRGTAITESLEAAKGVLKILREDMPEVDEENLHRQVVPVEPDSEIGRRWLARMTKLGY